MRLITCQFESQQMLGVWLAEGVFLPARHSDFAPHSMLDLIDAQAAVPELRALAEAASADQLIPPEQLEFLAPIPAPRQNILCLGWNYAEHVQETTGNTQLTQPELPKHPIVFTKDTAAVNGPYADVPYDADISQKMDWESELAFVIGKTAHKVSAAQAMDYVFGYTVINDITARDLQKRHRQFFLGKSLRGSCPMGPCIVTADEIEDPQNLAIKSWVNDEIKQDSSTCHQIFGVSELVVRLSAVMTLQPGTIIATGTPSGVGYVREPPEYLSDGDVVACEVEKVGLIRNRLVAAR